MTMIETSGKLRSSAALPLRRLLPTSETVSNSLTHGPKLTPYAQEASLYAQQSSHLQSLPLLILTLTPSLLRLLHQIHLPNPNPSHRPHTKFLPTSLTLILTLYHSSQPNKGGQIRDRLRAMRESAMD
jgi:hypothetical protein